MTTNTPTPTARIQGIDNLGEPNMIIVPCDEPRCLWQGGHVAEDWDPTFLHQALIVEEDGFLVEVNRTSTDGTWTLWAELNSEDGQTTSTIARDFTLALEIAEATAARLNGEVTK